MLCATAGEWVGELEGDEYVDGWSVVVARAALRAAAGGRGRGTSVSGCECCRVPTSQGIDSAQGDRWHTGRYPQGSAGVVPAGRAARRRTVHECEAIHRAGLAAPARGRRSAQIVHASTRVHRREGAGGHQHDARAGFGSRPKSRDRHLDSLPPDPGGGRCRRSLRHVPTRPSNIGDRGSHRIFQGQLAIGRSTNVLTGLLGSWFVPARLCPTAFRGVAVESVWQPPSAAGHLGDEIVVAAGQFVQA